MSRVFFRKFTNKKLLLSSGRFLRHPFQIRRDRVTLKKLEPVQWGKQDRHSWRRIPSTKWINRSLEVKQKIVTAKFRVIQFGQKFGGGKHGCTARQFRVKAREPWFALTNLSTSLGFLQAPQLFHRLSLSMCSISSLAIRHSLEKDRGFHILRSRHARETKKVQAIFSFPETR